MRYPGRICLVKGAFLDAYHIAHQRNSPEQTKRRKYRPRSPVQWQRGARHPNPQCRYQKIPKNNSNTILIKIESQTLAFDIFNKVNNIIVIYHR